MGSRSRTTDRHEIWQLYLTDVIIRSKFANDWYSSFGSAEVQSLPSPIGTKTRPYHMQPCRACRWCLIAQIEWASESTYTAISPIEWTSCRNQYDTYTAISPMSFRMARTPPWGLCDTNPISSNLLIINTCTCFEDQLCRIDFMTTIIRFFTQK